MLGSIHVLLAELEAETLGLESALARIDDAIALARQVENRCNLAFPHLLRGELLLKRDPSNPAPAEEAFQTALAIARSRARGVGVCERRSSAREAYQSTGELVECPRHPRARARRLSPTPKCQEIAERRRSLNVWRTPKARKKVDGGGARGRDP